MKAKGFPSEQDETWNHVKTPKCQFFLCMFLLRLQMCDPICSRICSMSRSNIPSDLGRDQRLGMWTFPFHFPGAARFIAHGAGLRCKYSRLGRGWFLFLVMLRAPWSVAKPFFGGNATWKGILMFFWGYASYMVYMYIIYLKSHFRTHTHVYIIIHTHLVFNIIYIQYIYISQILNVWSI